MRTKRFSLLVVVFIVLAVAAAAWARAYVIGASSFNSNGASISGWRWLRSSGNTATWTFSASELQGAKKVYINFNPLVTNGVDGGSGYDATVKYTITGSKKHTGTINAVNPFRPTDPANSGGVGYQCYGHSGEIPSNVFKGAHSLQVTISYPVTGGKHVAVNIGCISIGYSR